MEIKFDTYKLDELSDGPGITLFVENREYLITVRDKEEETRNRIFEATECCGGCDPDDPCTADDVDLGWGDKAYEVEVFETHPLCIPICQCRDMLVATYEVNIYGDVILGDLSDTDREYCILKMVDGLFEEDSNKKGE
jgi:hypothetical protein